MSDGEGQRTSVHRAKLPHRGTPTNATTRLSDQRLALIEAPEALSDSEMPSANPSSTSDGLVGFSCGAPDPRSVRRYLAVDPDSGLILGFDLHGKDGEGVGGDGARYTRFRSWKESLLAASGGPG